MPKHTDSEKRKNRLKTAGIKIFGQVSNISGRNPVVGSPTRGAAAALKKAKARAKGK